MLPTVLLMLAVVVVSSILVWRDQLATLKGGVVSSLAYVTNWWLIADHQPYFVSTGRPSMVQHLWSLAIEEQYYIVWSLVVMLVAGLLLRSRGAVDPERRLRFVVIVALVLAVVSTLLMAFFAIRADLPYGGSTDRVYYGSDTHTMGLFLGSAGGAWIALRRHRRAHQRPGRRTLALTDAIGLAAVVVVVHTFFSVNEFSPRLYRGGFLAFDAAVLLAVLCATRAGSLLGRVLDMRPIRWVGQRSYSIYIWHWPVVVVTRPDIDVHGPTLLINVARLVLILGLSALSYRYVEVPLRRGRTSSAGTTRPVAATPARGRAIVWVTTAVSAAVLVTVANPIASATPPPQATDAVSLGAGGGGSATHSTGHGAGPDAGSGVRSGPRPGRGSGPHVVEPPVTPAAASARHIQVPETPQSAAGHPHLKGPSSPHRGGTGGGGGGPVARPALSAFGDSVMLGAGSELQERTSVLKLDSVEGRQPNEILDDVMDADQAGTLEPNVVIDAGNNGIISPDQLRATLEAITPQHTVLLFNVRVDRPWQDPNNQTIHSVAPGIPHVTIVDWYSIAGQHPSWFWSDGLHLTPAGGVGFARVVMNALR